MQCLCFVWFHLLFFLLQHIYLPIDIILGPFQFGSNDSIIYNKTNPIWAGLKHINTSFSELYSPYIVIIDHIQIKTIKKYSVFFLALFLYPSLETLFSSSLFYYKYLQHKLSFACDMWICASWISETDAFIVCLCFIWFHLLFFFFCCKTQFSVQFSCSILKSKQSF